MAPHADSPTGNEEPIKRLPAPERPPMSEKPPRFLIIGAGSRGNSYARAMRDSSNGVCVAVAEPIAYKRQALGTTYIWGKGNPSPGQEFNDWMDFLAYEVERRKKAAAGEVVPEGVDGVFICVQDHLHKEVIVGLKELDLHVMCEKPLATNLDDCVAIYKSLLSSPAKSPSKIVSIGHVLRYSPHNMLLRKLLLEDKVIGDVMSVNHTEPVGWWHFSHSYVRGNWRRESTSAPSLLTKSCHDIDFLLWLLCSPPPKSPPSTAAHLPSTITASGALQYFNKSRKPAAAGTATNCLTCAAEPNCMYSAKKIYLGEHAGSVYKGLSSTPSLGRGNTSWPVNIVLPDIEDFIAKGGSEAGVKALTAKLAEDYDESVSGDDIAKRNWFGRCVYESDNDVCDDEAVIMKWDAEPQASRGPKIATFHMVAFTQNICERYSNIYGTTGEIYADGDVITVTDFASGSEKKYYPHVANAGGTGHGGGDDGLARQFVLAVDRVKNHGEKVAMAQEEYVGCSLEEIIRSHAMVFAAEEARKGKVVLDFPRWWEKEVQSRLGK